MQYIGRFSIYRKGVGLCTSKKDPRLCFRFDVHRNYSRANQNNYRRFDIKALFPKQGFYVIMDNQLEVFIILAV